MAKMKKIGHFNVRIVEKGDRYGLEDCLKHLGDDPLVEFYDTRYMHTPRGQFVSNYYMSTLMRDRDRRYGLDLHGGVPGWTVSAEDMQKVYEFLGSN